MGLRGAVPGIILGLQGYYLCINGCHPSHLRVSASHSRELNGKPTLVRLAVSRNEGFAKRDEGLELRAARVCNPRPCGNHHGALARTARHARRRHGLVRPQVLIRLPFLLSLFSDVNQFPQTLAGVWGFCRCCRPVTDLTSSWLSFQV